MKKFRFKTKLISAAMKTALATSAGILLFNSTTIYAEEAEDESADQTENKIVVTGSRLRRETFESPSPVTVTTAPQIERSGAITLGDVLADLPQFNSTFTSQNSGRFIGTAGIGSLDLRGLGTSRTLVLVNGRRHVPGSPASGSVDVNSLPAILIDRIETITGANAAVYGADAVTGVVNIILKDNIEQNQLRVSSGFAADSGFERQSFSYLTGTAFDEDKGSFTFAVSYDKQDELTAAQRGGVFTDLIATRNNPLDGDFIDDNGIEIDDGIPDRITIENSGLWAISDGGTIWGIPGHFNPDGSYSQLDLGTVEVLDGLRCGGTNCTPLDLSTFTDLQVGFQRYTLDANFKYNLTNETQLFVESRYSSLESNQQGQPSFNFFDLVISPDNAYLSPEVQALTGGGAFLLNRFHTDHGRRKEIDNRDTFRVVAGLNGTIADDWEWEAFASYGVTRLQRKNQNNRVNDRFFASADAVRLTQADVDSIGDSLGAAGDAVCRATLQEALTPGSSGLPSFAFDGCVPSNLFGNGSVSQEAINFFTQTAIGQFTNEQTQVQAYVVNESLIENWAGNVSFVFGADFREEVADGEEDTASALGLTFFNALSVARGRYNNFDVFTEFGIPLLSDVPFAENIVLEVAARSSDYSTIGSATTWEARLNWDVTDELAIRFNTGESFRAPDIGELFSPPGENFFGITDPCDMDALNQATNGIDNRIANCQALGIADPTTFVAADDVTVRGSSGGNPDLDGEDAETTTIGFVWSPSFLEGFNISVDYYEIEINAAISNTGAQAILDRCVDDPNGINNQFCSLNDRDDTGNVSFIRSAPVNLNTLISKGYDFELEYLFDIGEYGSIQTTLAGSFLDERLLILNTSDNVDLLDGELGTPELQYRFSANWSYNDLQVFATVQYIDEQLNGQQEAIFARGGNNTDPNPDASDNIFFEEKFYLDVGASYLINEGLKASLTVNNATDELPPYALFGNGGASAVYDNVGAYYHLALEYNF